MRMPCTGIKYLCIHDQTLKYAAPITQSRLLAAVLDARQGFTFYAVLFAYLGVWYTCIDST